MRYVRIVNSSRGTIVGTRIAVADRWWLRVRGLLGQPPLCNGEGLLLSPCRAVHMVGMGYALDVAFIDDRGRVVAAYRGLRPGAHTRWHAAAAYALELPAGTLDATATAEGDALESSTIEGES